MLQGYVLDGMFVATFPNTSSPEYTATYNKGTRTSEAMYDAEGRVLWRWNHTVRTNGLAGLLAMRAQ